MIKNTGGNAFPFAIATQDNNGQPLRLNEIGEGMTLRDWFAGQALQGLGTKVMARHQHASLGDSGDVIERARYAYRQADAMLAERSK